MAGTLACIVVEKRDGREVAFDDQRITSALRGAFCEDLNLEELDPDSEVKIQELTALVVGQLDQKNRVSVEEIQDEVERSLMTQGYFTVARRYIVYREARAHARQLRGKLKAEPIRITNQDGTKSPLNTTKLKHSIYQACYGLEDIQPESLLKDVLASLYHDIPEGDVERAKVLAARSRIEWEPNYSRVAARLLLQTTYEQVFDSETEAYVQGFADYVARGVQVDQLDPRLQDFDLDMLAKSLRAERDERFDYLGMQTLFDRYLLHVDDERFEAPQYLWMRVAMGLALNETEKEKRACEFYEVLSTLRFVSATPTLFNSGTRHPQLSSCYLSTVGDDLTQIFKGIADNAQLSKWAGGLGNDWTSVRATGAKIKGTNGVSQGVIPFLKVVNDTAVAVNQGGKRKGAVCCYLETWHLDIEEFLDLRKNTGDDRRRTHDMNTANWIPDLFMKRVSQSEHWTLFSPDAVPDLHDLYGKAFEERYEEYEALADQGQIRLFRRVEARELWRKMLSMLFETGHPWITFKDPSNLRSPQDHVGVVHSSNLCTEILLNTNAEETAVCNLGSVNLAEHVSFSGVDVKMLSETVSTAMRMLDNVVDINFYPTRESEAANKRHRPVGLGVMGFQDALFQQRIAYASDEAVEFADRSMELISYHAIQSSSDLAKERGAYSSYEGSKWDRGLLPIDTLDLVADARGGDFDVDRSVDLDWEPVRRSIALHGMRNSCVMAIAPTATIGNIAGVYQSIEPAYRNLFVKSNLSGEFTISNRYLVQDLKELNLWDAQMLEDLKYYDGSIQEIERVPKELKELYRTAFEVDVRWLIDAASRRQKWIDMGISLNLYLAQPIGKLLDEMYFHAWRKGLKTTYYLRALAATQIEKSSMDVNKRSIQPRWMKAQSASSRIDAPQACSIDDPECEACQ